MNTFLLRTLLALGPLMALCPPIKGMDNPEAENWELPKEIENSHKVVLLNQTGKDIDLTIIGHEGMVKDLTINKSEALELNLKGHLKAFAIHTPQLEPIMVQVEDFYAHKSKGQKGDLEIVLTGKALHIKTLNRWIAPQKAELKAESEGKNKENQQQLLKEIKELNVNDVDLLIAQKSIALEAQSYLLEDRFSPEKTFTFGKNCIISAFCADKKKVLVQNTKATEEMEYYIKKLTSKEDFNYLCNLPSTISWLVQPTFSYDGSKIATKTDKGIAIWDATSGKEVKIIDTPTSPEAYLNTEFIWNKDTTIIAVLSLAGLTIWDTETWDKKGPISKNPGGRPVALSPDGRKMASAYDHQAKLILWSTENGSEINIFQISEKPREFIKSLTWSPDGKMIAVGLTSIDGKAIILDAETGQILTILDHGKNDEDDLYLPSIAAVAFCPNKNIPLLATHTTDGTLRLWNYQSGKELASFTDLEARKKMGLLKRMDKCILEFNLEGNKLYLCDNSNPNEIKMFNTSAVDPLTYWLNHTITSSEAALINKAYAAQMAGNSFVITAGSDDHKIFCELEKKKVTRYLTNKLKIKLL